jgi:glycosyltransferase involved in cell wall biosynthesis
MRIVLIGDIGGNLDEGMKKTTFNLYQGLSESNEVLVKHPRQALQWSTIKQVREFRPQVVHYVHGPSIRSLMVARWLAACAGRAKVFISALHPSLSSLNRLLIPLLPPDLVFVQSERSQDFFQRAGCQTEPLPNGVNLDRFMPVPTQRKRELRREHGIADQDFVVLHVGSVQISRNICMLADMQKELKIHVVVVGSTTEGPEDSVVERLRSAGCTVWLRFFSQVEHLFQLADCYAFPVLDEMGCIQVPLTVLEAAACNLPIVTTPFGGLGLFLPEGKGLYYVTGKDEMRIALSACMKDRNAQTRSLVESFSWGAICQRVLEQYSAVVDQGK